jgi:hypothetical protein
VRKQSLGFFFFGRLLDPPPPLLSRAVRRRLARYATRRPSLLRIPIRNPSATLVHASGPLLACGGVLVLFACFDPSIMLTCKAGWWCFPPCHFV